MSIKERILQKKEKIAVVGLGYVGMPIAVSFAKIADVVGFDINHEKIETYKNGIDPTKEVGDEVIKNTTMKFTDDPKILKDCHFIIVAVPTPVRSDNVPDLYPLESSSRLVGQNISKGTIVVYESTVYPGVTEDFCVKIIEKESGLKCGIDFKVGYSPERINPGDKVHRLETIKKIVSGMDAETLKDISEVYQLIITAGVFEASSIKVAEAAKVIENSQRDINIAFMNELSIIFNRINIDTNEVLAAAGTKWNFLNFKPGLVGGHCIGIDPYYLTYLSEQSGYHSKVILAGRRINDQMGSYIASETIKKMIQANILVKESKVGILGITFKENCPDVRNSKVNDIILSLNTYGISPLVCDPVADSHDALKLYGIKLANISEMNNLDCLIIAVAHDEFAALTHEQILRMFKNLPNDKKVLIDVKGVKDRHEFLSEGLNYWRL